MIDLFSAQARGDLTCRDVANYLNRYTDEKKDESYYRRFYRGFDAGRKYESRKIYGDTHEKILCIGDLHIPYNLPVETFRSYFDRIDTLVLAGDLMDMKSISKFRHDNVLSPVQEMCICRDYLYELIASIAPKKVIVIYGNHEMRFGRYLSDTLDTDIKELLPKNPLDLIINDGFTRYDSETKTTIRFDPIAELFPDIEITNTHNWWVLYGKTIFCHPMAFRSGIMKTAENAMQWFRNEGLIFTSLVMAHTHRIGYYVIGNTTIFETGCTCDISKIDYANGKLVNSQKEGFLWLAHDENGEVYSHRHEVLN